MSKEVTIAQLLDDPENQAIFGMNNVERYKGFDIYEQDGHTLATKLVKSGVEVYSLKSVGSLTRQALKAKIDSL